MTNESDGEHHDPQPDTDTVPLIQPQGTHAVAFVTIPCSPEDQPLLDYLRANDSLWIVPTDSNEPQTDYSPYELIILGPKPNSAAAAYANLRGYNRPTLLLKPLILKPSVWNWATPVNTSDLAVSVSQPQHPLFRGLTLTGDSLTFFSYCNTNAVTAVSDWTDTSGFEPLASPVSQPDATSVAWLPAGSRCNGTVLPQPMIMIGLSEYSTAYLTHDAQQLILNAVYSSSASPTPMPTPTPIPKRTPTPIPKNSSSTGTFISASATGVTTPSAHPSTKPWHIEKSDLAGRFF